MEEMQPLSWNFVKTDKVSWRINYQTLKSTILKDKKFARSFLVAISQRNRTRNESNLSGMIAPNVFYKKHHFKNFYSVAYMRIELFCKDGKKLCFFTILFFQLIYFYIHKQNMVCIFLHANFDIVYNDSAFTELKKIISFGCEMI